MMARKLPSVLQADKGNSISMQRALEQIKRLLLAADIPEDLEDHFHASFDDLETMIAAIDRD